MRREASARWEGGLSDGIGSITGASGAFKDLPYSFKTRFETEPGTNPEELIAAAHAGCFAMALAKQLEDAGHAPSAIDAEALVTMEKSDTGFSVTKSHLNVNAKVPGCSEDVFMRAANAAKEGCPISKLLKAEITMDAKLNP